MSTKSTIASGEDFHFYREMFDDENVHLWLKGADFAAYPGSVTVSIPLAILETIRRTKPMDFSLVEVSDEELLGRATAEVDEQRREADEWRRNNPDWEKRAHASLLAPDTVPREERIGWAFDDYKKEREQQKTVLARMKTYEISNGALFGFNFREGTSEVLVGNVTDGNGQSVQPAGAGRGDNDATP